MKDFENDQIQEISDSDNVSVQDKGPEIQQNNPNDDLESALISLLSKKKTKDSDLEYALRSLLKEKTKKNRDDLYSTDQSLNKKDYHYQDENDLDSTDQLLLNKNEPFHLDLSSIRPSHYEDEQIDLTLPIKQHYNIEKNNHLYDLTTKANSSIKTDFEEDNCSRPLSNNTTILTQRQENITNNQVQRSVSTKRHYNDYDQEDQKDWQESHRTRLVSPTGEYSLSTSNNNKEV